MHMSHTYMTELKVDLFCAELLGSEQQSMIAVHTQHTQTTTNPL